MKVEKRLKVWYNRCLSCGGRFTLIKSVIEAIPVYWMSLFLIPKYVNEKIRKLSSKFLWSEDREKRGIALVK